MADLRFESSHCQVLLCWGWVLAAVAGLGSERAAAQTTAPPTTAAARLKLIAEEPQPQAVPTATSPEKTAPPVASAPATPTKNDPTVPSPAIRELLGTETPGAPAATPSIPDLRLRARVIVHGKPPTALVEIGGNAARAAAATPGGPTGSPAGRSGYFRTIREGDEFDIPQGDATSPVRVVKLSASEVVVEIVNRKLLIRLD